MIKKIIGAFILTTALFLFFRCSTSAQIPTCSTLLKYRDSQLVDDYDKAMSRYIISEGAKADILKIKNDLLNDTRWAVSDDGLFIGIIAQKFLTECNLINNLLLFHPAAGTTEVVLNTGIETVEGIYKSTENGKSIKDIVQEMALSTTAMISKTKINPLMHAVTTANALRSDISKMVTMPKDRIKLKDDIKRVLDMIDIQIVKYDKEINENNQRIQDIDRAKKAIDNYYDNFCSPKTYLPEYWEKSRVVYYGDANPCQWSLQISKWQFPLTVDRQLKIVRAGNLQCSRVEHTVRGNCVQSAEQYDTYTYFSCPLNGNKITIKFKPAATNIQIWNLTFDGVINLNTITGTLTWERNGSPYSKFGVPITLGLPNQ